MLLFCIRLYEILCFIFVTLIALRRSQRNLNFYVLYSRERRRTITLIKQIISIVHSSDSVKLAVELVCCDLRAGFHK